MNSLIQALIQRLSGIPGFGVSYWRDTASEYESNQISVRDVGIEFLEVNQQVECTLAVEIEIVVFGEDSPEQSNAVLEEVIKRLRPSFPGVRRSVLREAEKLCLTAARRSCRVVLRIGLVFRRSVEGQGHGTS